jgi:hypothetical protein
MTEEEIARIHAIEDDSERNNEITLGYHVLSEQLADFTGSETVNWCAWAKWTSKTIGIGIRWGEVRELARKRVDDRSDRIFNRWAATRAISYFAVGVLMRLNTTATRLASRLVADGNRDVFFEVATSVTRLVERFGDSEDISSKDLDDYLAQIENVAPAGSLAPTAVDEMRAAMRGFVKARTALSPSVRDQRVLAANMHLAAYEQERLQRVVEQSLWGPVDLFFKPLVLLSKAVPRPVRGPLGWPARKLRAGLRTGSVWVTTRYVLVVVTKDEVIRLGKAMKPAPGNDVVFVSPYDEPTCSQLSTAVRDLLGPCDVSRPMVRVWTQYPQRVKFTAVLFRSRHGHTALRGAPMDSDEHDLVLAERGRRERT